MFSTPSLCTLFLHPVSAPCSCTLFLHLVWLGLLPQGAYDSTISHLSRVLSYQNRLWEPSDRSDVTYQLKKSCSLKSRLATVLTLSLDMWAGLEARTVPLHMKGSRGALFKVRLSSHGYTLVAKRMANVECKYLVHESKVYDYLRPIQGLHPSLSRHSKFGTPLLL
jgi:hypothetical protein